MTERTDPVLPTDPPPERRRGFWRTTGRFVVRALLVILVWWGIAKVLPGFPTPLEAAMPLLHLVKRVSDDLYVSANRERLERAARDVMRTATESTRQGDSARRAPDSLPPERRKRLPAIPLREDSVLRAHMKDISTRAYIGGRVIHILLIGIDSRLGVRDARADAIHLFTVNPDSGVVEILSVPRDTYCDLGYPDTTSFNIIANARALGMQGLIKRIEDLTGLRPIRYWAEVGFSQAMGVLEVLGYRDPVATLEFLRTRKTLPGGDIQRSHNQAMFLRSNLLGKFTLLTGATGDLFLGAGLRLISTNLTKDFCQGLVYMLAQKNFPHNREDAVRVRMLPQYKIRLKEMKADSATIEATLARTRRIVGTDDEHTVDVAAYLRKLIREAIADSARPGRVITRLRRVGEQHAWLQIQDPDVRVGIRDTLLTRLEAAYRRLGRTADADAVLQSRKAEDLLLPGTGKP